MINQRESRIEQFLKRQQEKDEENRAGHLLHDLNEYLSKTFIRSRLRATLTAAGAFGAVFLSVFCIVHIMARSAINPSGEKCDLQTLPYDWILLGFWTMLLVVVPIVLLYRNKCRPKVEGQETQPTHAPQTTAHLQHHLTTGIAHQPEPEPEPNLRLAPSSTWRHTSENLALTAIQSVSEAESRPASDDGEYDSGGEDDPNWRTKRLGGAE